MDTIIELPETTGRFKKHTSVKGVFAYPIGISFLQRGTGDYPTNVLVSTVCLDGVHNEDPLGICSPEQGYETLVFLEGCTLFHVFREVYTSRQAAENGHESVVRRLLAGDIELAIPLQYRAWE